MKADQEFLSFGRYLQRIRLEKNISLEKVSQETRIGLRTLKLIEKEDHDQLPAEVFVKGFLRAYARAIGADGDEAVDRYQSRLLAVRQLPSSAFAAQKLSFGLWWKLPLVLVVFSAIVYLSIQGVSLWQRPSSSHQAFEKQAPLLKSKADLPVSQKEPEAAAAPAAKIMPEKLLLQVTAGEDTWLKVIADDGDALEYNLKSGDSIKLEAFSNFSLLIGNAGGLQVSLNDKPVLISGKKGEIVTLQLP